VSSQILYAPLFDADTYEYSNISINSILASLYAAPDLKRQEAAAAASCVATCHIGQLHPLATWPHPTTSDRSNVGLAQSICRSYLCLGLFLIAFQQAKK
jgi:hypothetical protein